MNEKIEVENVNHPGKTERVDAEKYHAMHEAMLKVLPSTAPGMTSDDIRDAVKPHLPQTLFPGGQTSGWWFKCVQLDLEAKHIIARSPGRPLRLYKSQGH